MCKTGEKEGRKEGGKEGEGQRWEGERDMQMYKYEDSANKQHVWVELQTQVHT